MKHFMRSLRAALRQRGSILILTAFALPVILAGIGFAVDAGNIYVHKAQLQNAADAAALGGAKVGIGSTKNIANFDTSAANQAAADLVAIDVGNGKALVSSSSKKSTEQWQYATDKDGKNVVVTSTFRYLKSKSNANARYYTVEAQQNVPLLFLKYFLRDEEVTVSASSYVKLVQSGGKNYFPDLFVYEKGMYFTNSIDNPNNPQEHPATGVDGRAVCWSDEGMPKNTEDDTVYSSQNEKYHAFFSTKAAEEYKTNGLTSKQAMDMTKMQFNANGDVTNEGYWTTVEQDKTYDTKAFWDDIAGPMAEKAIAAGNITKRTDPDSQYLADHPVMVYSFDTMDSQNIDVNIDKEIPGDENEPIYIILKDGQWRHLQKFGMQLKADTRRPIIVALEPTEVQWQGNIQIEINSHKFRGILYAPTSNTDEGIHVNLNKPGGEGGVFEGSLLARYLKLEGGPGSYTHKNYGGGGSGGSSSGIVDMNLSNDSDDIDFDS